MKKIVIVLVGVVFIISGCTSKKDVISMEKAKAYALKEVSGEVVGYDKDLEDSDPTYSFEIVKDDKKYDIEIDAVNGEVLSLEQDNDYVAPKKDETNNNTNSSEHAVTQQDAEAVALDIAGGGKVTKAYLDHEDNHTNCTWDIEVVNGVDKYEVEVHADTKAIVSQEKDHVND